MAKTLECPNCGAPLTPNGSGLMQCDYCERHVVGPAREAARPAPAREPAPERPPRAEEPRKKQRKRGSGGPAWAQSTTFKIAAAVVGALIFAGALWLQNRPKGAASDINSDEVTRKLELSATHPEVTALFGSAMHPSSRQDNATVDFLPSQGKVRRIELSRDLPGKNQISKVVVHFHNFDKAAVLARIAEVAPNRARAQNASNDRVFLGDAVLDITPTYLSIWHWSSVHPANGDYAVCAERLAAYWALARFAALDGPTLTPEQKKLVNGPTLDEIAKLDTTVTVEQAADAFQKQFPSGWCRMQAGMMCVADTDDALVTEARWLWPNGLRANVHEAKLTFGKRDGMDKVQRAVAGCLQPALGNGEETVVDYVRGTRTFTWKMDDGGTVVLGERELILAAPQAAPVDQPAAWVSRFAAVLGAIDKCAI